jgi:hypothetical protein
MGTFFDGRSRYFKVIDHVLGERFNTETKFCRLYRR